VKKRFSDLHSDVRQAAIDYLKTMHLDYEQWGEYKLILLQYDIEMEDVPKYLIDKYAQIPKF